MQCYAYTDSRVAYLNFSTLTGKQHLLEKVT